VGLLICLANDNVHVEKVFHSLACQAVAFGAHIEKFKMRPAFTSLRRGSLAFRAAPKRRLAADPAALLGGTSGSFK